jgi:transcription elongation factor SPT5
MANIKDARFDSDSDDGEDFNPEPALGSDDEAGSDVEVAVKPKSKSTSRKATPPSRDEPNGELDDERDGDLEDDDNQANGKDNDEDNEDDIGDDENEAGENDDDDDEENVTGRPRKRARRDPRNQFIDIEAEVDDEDEADEDDEEEGAADFIAKDHPDDLDDIQPGTEHDDRRHRELDRKRELEQQMDAEKQAALLKERYGRRQVAAQQVSQVPRRLLLPSVDDPSIWGVRCKPGKEREVVFSILKRWEERLGSKNPLPIFSAFERGSTSMSGYVYVEARKQGDVLSALEGILFCYPRTKMVLVAIKEMPDLLRVQQSEQLQPGGYVRLRAGKYKGDLAQIDDVESNGLEVTLRIVPRLDYGLHDDTAKGEVGPDGKRKRGFAFQKGGPIPPQRLFSEAEARKRHSTSLQAMSTFDKKQWQYLGDMYVNGYLIKDYRIQQLQTKNVNPTLEEVSRFATGSEDGTENLDLTALATSLKNNSASHSYLPGDTVEIYEGEQSGITGKATAVRADIVTINVTEGDLKGQIIDVPMKGIRKRFRPGDHVKIIGGSRFRDEVGMVVSLKGDQVTMVSDLTMQEITVFSKDLREATDTGAAGGLGSYDIHDLVQLEYVCPRSNSLLITNVAVPPLLAV